MDLKICETINGKMKKKSTIWARIDIKNLLTFPCDLDLMYDMSIYSYFKLFTLSFIFIVL